MTRLRRMKSVLDRIDQPARLVGLGLFSFRCWLLEPKDFLRRGMPQSLSSGKELARRETHAAQALPRKKAATVL